MHAAILADQPFQLARLVIFILVEAHQCPGVCREFARIVIDAHVLADFVAQIIPLAASHLTGLAANTGSDIDQLGNLHLFITHLCRRCQTAGRRAPDNILGLH